MRGTGSVDDPGVLGLDFPGGAGSGELEHISWHEWFQRFEANGLGLVHQAHKPVAGTAPSASW